MEDKREWRKRGEGQREGGREGERKRREGEGGGRRVEEALSPPLKVLIYNLRRFRRTFSTVLNVSEVRGR